LTYNKSKYILTIEEIKMYHRVKGDWMMPLTMAPAGEENVIKKVGGKEETRLFLERLGFVVGGAVTVVSAAGGNVIVNVKESRVAIGKDMANKIMV
jgi:ferrous iron transport protein A